jgi:hypothetical protein
MLPWDGAADDPACVRKLYDHPDLRVPEDLSH